MRSVRTKPQPQSHSQPQQRWRRTSLTCLPRAR
ncbi:hypothetical protein STRTUCAR8_06615, partial [Streptomyces turgidiscabies Car8]